MGPKRKTIWKNIIFFAVTTLLAVFGCPLYLWRHGLSVPEVALFAFYLVATGMSITVGYHRLFSHVTFKANPVMQFFLLFFGAAAFEQSALDWSSQHRDHHRYVDTEQDPYSIKKGFFYAHIGWLIFWEHETNHENVHDLRKNKLVMHQHENYLLWAVAAGIFLPVILGGLSGHMLGAFLFSVCLRLTLVYHSTFFINSVCHMFGKATYDIHATAKDHWFVALITNGEGYHNFHHRFPSDYRNGVRWYQWDPSKWFIALMSRMKLAWDLKTVSKYRILEARLTAENLRMLESLKETDDATRLQKVFETLRSRYEKIRQNLADWEKVSIQYREVLHARVSGYSKGIRLEASKKVDQAQKQFQAARAQWVDLIQRNPLDLKLVLLNGV